MANPTEAFTGTETVGTTEHSMTTDTAGPDTETSDGYFHAVIDFTNMAAGDVFEWRLYEKVTSGASQVLSVVARFADAQGAPLWFSPPLPLLHGWDMTLKKISGTDRSITWSIRKAT